MTRRTVESATKVKDDPSKTPVTEPRCMIRATDGASGKKKIKASTIVRSETPCSWHRPCFPIKLVVSRLTNFVHPQIAAKDVPQFQKTLAVVIKSHTDALKKKEKKKKAGKQSKV